MFPLSDSINSNRFPLFNILLILVTICVFLLQLFSSNPGVFAQKYALIPAYVSLSNPHTWYPFITAIFLHGGFLHIITNMWFLWIFGDDVEGYLGHLFYLLLYFGAGIIGNIVQFAFIPHSSIPMLGASGAIAGVLGAYFVLFPQSQVRTLIPIFGFFTIVNIAAPIMLGYWFVLQLISGAASLPFMSTAGGVAFWAHVGGFVTGMVFGFLLKKESMVS